jgi:hypothetical protein
VSDVKVAGMDPDREFEFNSSRDSPTILPTDGGRDEEIEFEERSNSVSATS